MSTTPMSQLGPLRLEDDGRILIPLQIRKELDLSPGDNVVIRKTASGGFEFVSARTAAEQMIGFLRTPQLEGRSIVEEFLAEKRTEAERE